MQLPFLRRKMKIRRRTPLTSSKLAVGCKVWQAAEKQASQRSKGASPMQRKPAKKTPRDSLASTTTLNSAVKQLPSAAVAENEDKIVIERAKWQEAPVNDENAKNGNGVATESTADGYWKEKFTSLKELRETEPERELEELRRCAEEREAALVRTVRLLEQKLSVRRAADPEGRCGDSVEEMEDRLAEQETLLRWYETLTCMKLKLIDDDCSGGTSVVATALNRTDRKLTQMVLSGDELTSEITHSPEANVDELPEFLQQDVTFHSSQAPMYVCSILNKLHSHDERS